MNALFEDPLLGSGLMDQSINNLRLVLRKRANAMAARRAIGDLQVWWVPQVPMRAFVADVPDVSAGALLLDALAFYDMFQLIHGIKPDYSNAGGLQRWCADSDGEGKPGWEDWYDEETGDELAKFISSKVAA